VVQNLKSDNLWYILLSGTLHLDMVDVNAEELNIKIDDTVDLPF